MEVWPGKPSPLGASWEGEGTNFALATEVASAVELCLFPPGPPGREVRVVLPEAAGPVRHGFVPGVGPGWTYGYRVAGPFAPASGFRANPAKLLLDPYATAIAGGLRWHEALCGSIPGQDDRPDGRDSAPYVPRSVVTEPAFDWEGDRPPATPWHETVILELHVKAMTARHPELPPGLRGTYAGLGHPEVTGYLSRLGVTAVELLPVHHFVAERQLVERGLTNFWGYNPIGWFAPHAGYSSSGDRGGQVAEFKAMVRALHSAGLEVILDVVYNHTAEGGSSGPTLSLRGIDNPGYYRLAVHDRREYVDYAGTGNTVDTRRPLALQTVLDSLRYWVRDMHVDGFRFDLASALTRGEHGVDWQSAFLNAVRQDPVLSGVKLIAEPWDVGEGGYQVGQFPWPWSEWNGRYRDSVRDFWRGRARPLSELGYRLTGSSDLYQRGGRTPRSSVNFVTCHDGFTLRDLVSYEAKHNLANGEDNRDGTDDNRSWNCGVEGETDRADVLALRARQQRNLLTTVLLSQGVPMLLAGDERGHSQAGNNNAYCHDSELTWLDWSPGPEGLALAEFTRELIALRRAHPVFRRRRFLHGLPDDREPGLPDVGWFTPTGAEMTAADWSSGDFGALGMFLNGSRIGEPGPRGEAVVDDSFLVILNGDGPLAFRMPPKAWAASLEVVLSTCAGDLTGRVVWAEQELALEARSVVVMKAVS